jgi:guanylate kinase
VETNYIARERSGKLILNSGLSGVGKSTLAAHAVAQFPNLAYLKTFTTRGKRSDESDLEYDFTDDDEYETVKRRALSWDESIIHGLKYGNDPRFYIDQIQQGENYLVNCYPSLSIVEPMLEVYRDVPSVVLLIDAPNDIRVERLKREHDIQRLSRLAIECVENEYLGLVDYRFRPRNDLLVDKKEYTNLIGRIIYGENYLFRNWESKKV